MTAHERADDTKARTKGPRFHPFRPFQPDLESFHCISDAFFGRLSGWDPEKCPKDARQNPAPSGLTRIGQHRVPIPDLVVAGAAQHAGLVVLHYDADFERIAAVGGPAHEWVVARGAV
jgi:hypothetical protein